MSWECPQEFFKWLMSRQTLQNPPQDAGCEYVVENEAASAPVPPKTMAAGASPHDN
jgi:hypothetical protein